MTRDSKWITDRYPTSHKDVLLDDLLDGRVVGYYDTVTDEFYSTETHRKVDAVRGWQELPAGSTEFTTLKQRVLSKGSNLTVEGNLP